MTLLFFDGLQDAVLVPKPEYVSANPWSGAGTGRDGSSNGAGNGPGNGNGRIINLPSAAATCIMGNACYFGSGSLGGSNSLVIGFCSDAPCANPTCQLCITVNTAGFIEARRTSPTGTLLGTSSGHQPIFYQEWHHYAMKGVLHTSAGSCVVRLDDKEVLNLSGIATSSVTGSVLSTKFFSGGGVFANNYDDIYICDGVDATATQGRPNNDFLGDLKIVTMVPTAAGDTTGWTPSTAPNWGAVDEIPVNTTDYVSTAAATTGTRDLYNLNDLPANANLVYGIREGLYCQKSDAGTANIKTTIKESGGTITSGSSQPRSEE